MDNVKKYLIKNGNILNSRPLIKKIIFSLFL